MKWGLFRVGSVRERILGGEGVLVWVVGWVD